MELSVTCCKYVTATYDKFIKTGGSLCNSCFEKIPKTREVFLNTSVSHQRNTSGEDPKEGIFLLLT
jgi:hypothetical protein